MTKTNTNILDYIIPGIIGLLFNSLYIIVDGIFVAKILGSNSLAAVTVVVPIVEILIALSLMISIGCGTYISLNKGKDNMEDARNYFNQGFIITNIISITITILFLFFNNTIINLLGVTQDIFLETKEYFIWFSIFIPFFMLNYSLGTWVRNDDNPKLAMFSQIFGAILNISLDYIFMAKLNMGIKGAAIATGLGPVFGIIILMPHFLFKKGNLYFEKVKLNLKKAKNIMIAGLPSFAIEFSLGITTFLCNLFISSKFKEMGLAAFGIIGYINLVLLSIYLGIGQGTQPLISIYHGQGDYKKIEEIYHLSIKLSIIISIIAYIVLITFNRNIINIFIEYNEYELMELTLKAIKLFFIAMPITGVNIVTASIFEAKQYIKPSILISSLRSIIFLLPVLLLLNISNNPMLIWLAVPIAEIITVFPTIKLWITYKDI